MRLAITLLLICRTIVTLGTTFTVTTNADSGPGSLRDAITQANANGSAAPDLIDFNITDQTRAGRTITLVSVLPDLNSNLTIDGTTQPGTPFGISAARIIITSPSTASMGYYFQALSADNIKFYGLFLQSIYVSRAFHFRSSSNLIIGAAGKGNIMQGFTTAIQCDPQAATDPKNHTLTIQGNIMGTDENGTSIGPGQINANNIDLNNVYDLRIGGLNPNEGNLMNQTYFPFNYSDNYNDDFGFLNFQGNKVGVDITGSTQLSPGFQSIAISGYNTGFSNRTGNTPLLINITGNITSGGYQLFGISSPFVIQGNHIGVALDNVTKINNGTIGIQNNFTFQVCGKGLIGGPNPADKNYIAYNQTAVVELFTGPITISQNSFFCHQSGIEKDLQTPIVNVTTLTTGMVGGTTSPNATVELFYDDACPGCEGKTYIATVTADASGSWSYPLTPTGAIVATATGTDGSTSEFSKASINTLNVVEYNATCGRSNGSIKNMQIVSGTEWYWQDAAGNKISTSKDLENVGPGTYTFVASIGNADCNVTSRPFTLTNVDLPAFDPAKITITQPGCGQSNGAITFNGIFDPAANYTWSNASTAKAINNLAPGSYSITQTLKDDPTCSATYGPFVLTNQSGPSLVNTAARITGTKCSAPNGAVTGITVQNAVNPVYIAWRDDKGATVSNTLDLTNAKPGVYRLVLKDGSTCDTIYTASYTIPDQGTITFDPAAVVITPASCTASNGAITGINASNAETYTWTDRSTGTVVGTNPDLGSLAGGTYQLTMTNTLGCHAATPVYTVTKLVPPAAPQVQDQMIPRNTSASIQVTDPQTGIYTLLEAPNQNANVLDRSDKGLLHTPNLPQNSTYYIGLTNGDCVSPLAAVHIKVFDSVQIFVPNAFTPNGDGKNDKWHLAIRGLTKKIQITIFDRWGAQVLNSNDPNLYWDGSLGGHALSGTFVYLIAGLDYYNKPFQLRGTITIVR